MKRKALLVGMAVMASLPGGAWAKGAGKMDYRLGRLYHGYGTLVTGLPMNAGEISELAVSREEDGEAAVARLKSVLGKVSWNAGEVWASNGRGWKMEMLQSLQPQMDIRLSGNDDPRVRTKEPVGFVLHYTF